MCGRKKKTKIVGQLCINNSMFTIVITTMKYQVILCKLDACFSYRKVTNRLYEAHTVVANQTFYPINSPKSRFRT